MAKFVIFGGTTEGREIADFLDAREEQVILFLATEYGAEQIEESKFIDCRVGRLDAEEMRKVLEQEEARYVIDATHPHAREVSRNIQEACKKAALPYFRVRRESVTVDEAKYFDCLEEMLEYLQGREGKIFSSLGLKAAESLTQLDRFQERLIMRVLPDYRGLKHLEELGYPRKHIIAMQGPFSSELNDAMFKAVEAEILISKDSGYQGGFLEKIEAARANHMEICLLRLPEEEGFSLSEMKEKILEVQGVKG